MIYTKEHNTVAAREGEYGTRAYDRDAMYCETMLVSIEREMPDATAFTRDDIMNFPAFAHVATITRYNYAGRAIRYGLQANKVLEVGRGLYILAGTKRRYQQSVHTNDEYDATVTRIAYDHHRMYPDVPFGVADLLTEWTTDHHLSTSSKRSLLREGLRRLAGKKVVMLEAWNTYVYTGK
jgi:hypothetical protein